VEKQRPFQKVKKHKSEIITMPPPACCFVYFPSFPQFSLVKNECLVSPERINAHPFLEYVAEQEPPLP